MFHQTTCDVEAELGTDRGTPRTLTKHRLSIGLGAKISAQYFTYWGELEQRTWEYEEEFEPVRK